MGAGDIKQFQRRWQQSIYVEAILYAVGFAGGIYVLTHNVIFGIIALVVSGAITIFILRPWQVSQEKAVAYIDAHLPQAGYSSGLLLSPTHELSNLSKL